MALQNTPTQAIPDVEMRAVMPVFIAWALKATIMKVGGVQLYRRAQPAFLGLMAGYTFGVVRAFIVDWIWFPGQGHLVHYW